LRYHLKIEGLAQKPDSQDTLLIGRGGSALDPLFITQAWKYKLTALLSPNMLKKLPGWLARGLSIFKIPRHVEQGAGFSAQRLKKRLRDLTLGGDLLVFPEGRKSPLLAELLKRSPQRAYFVQVLGMEGSHFSSHPKGRVAYFWVLIKNGLFFMPRRQVTVIFTPVPAEFPWQGNSEEINGFVEHWFSAHARRSDSPDVPYYFWKKSEGSSKDKVSEMVLQEIARLAKKQEILPDQDLYADLSLDSLDVTELLVFIEKTFHEHVHFDALRTVRDAILAAQGHHPHIPSLGEIKEQRTKGWTAARKPVEFAAGKTIPEAFLRSCDRMGTAAATVDPQDVLSYTRLKTVVLGLVEFCEKFPGKNVGVLLPSLNETVALILALMMAKKVPTMMNWTLGNHHLEEIAQQANLQVIVTLGPFLERMGYDLSDALVEKVVLIEDLRAEMTTEHRSRTVKKARLKTESLIEEFKLKSDDVAVLLFTSGTEKAPKGVPLTHKNLLSNQKSAIEKFPFRAEDVMMGILPPFHVFGFSLTHLMPILMGCRMVLHPLLLDLAAISHLIEYYRVTVVCTAPTFLRGLLALNKPSELQHVRSFIVGAEKTPPLVREQLHRLNPAAQLLEGYGLTECSPLVALNNRGDPARGVGWPIRDLEILDLETHQLLARGKEGIIAVAGPHIFQGYLNGKTPFIELNGKRWFLTGDLGSLDEQGALHLRGRISRSAKIGGELISFPALEQSLQAAFPEAQMAIVGEENEDGVQLILYTNKTVSLEMVNQTLQKAGWSNLVRIKKIKVLPELPLSSTGKIDYKKLITF
ncbi:MAG TPA: AMP-binding protein, partial [Rhabdochlamydiaceae bacterium]|nr:AMP-binding protein [Rhabdochlamydiaceae bacterium]